MRPYCVAPWVHLHTLPNGDTYPCCLITQNKTTLIGNVNDTKLDAMWNSDNIKRIRKEFLGNKSIPECSYCIMNEKNNINSLRLNLLKRDDVGDYRPYTNEDGSVNSRVKLQRVDFRFSNLCNQECLSCSPLYSSKIAKSNIKKYNNNMVDDTKQSLYEISADAKEDILDTIRNNVDVVSEMYFAGGEPLINQMNWDILDILEENNNRSMLRYNTNLSTLNYKGRSIIDKWDKMENPFLITVSIDGIGDLNDFIRKGSKWNNTISNLRTLYKWSSKNPKQRDLMLVPTLSLLNIHKIVDYLKYFHDNFGMDMMQRIHINTLNNPEHLTVYAMPMYIREQIASNIENDPFMCKLIGTHLETDIINHIERLRDTAIQYKTNNTIDFFKSQGNMEAIKELYPHLAFMF